MAGRDGSFVLLLTGPAGAGKTTVADAWARVQTIPTLHLSLDDVRERVKAGYADPQAGWNAETARQLALARAAIADVARRYLSAGFRCVIDDAVFPAWPQAGLEAWREELSGEDLRPVVLMPSLEVILRRNRLRTGARRLDEPMLRIIYEMMGPWWDQGEIPVIDTTDLNVEQVVQQIETLLAG